MYHVIIKKTNTFFGFVLLSRFSFVPVGSFEHFLWWALCRLSLVWRWYLENHRATIYKLAWTEDCHHGLKSDQIFSPHLSSTAHCPVLSAQAALGNKPNCIVQIWKPIRGQEIKRLLIVISLSSQNINIFLFFSGNKPATWSPKSDFYFENLYFASHIEFYVNH